MRTEMTQQEMEQSVSQIMTLLIDEKLLGHMRQPFHDDIRRIVRKYWPLYEDILRYDKQQNERVTFRFIAQKFVNVTVEEKNVPPRA